MRILIVLGNGLLCLGITYLLLTWAVTVLSYDIGSYYFYQKLDSVSGITQANAGQFKWVVINEMWFRLIIPGAQSQMCFSGNAIVCQLADGVSKSSGSLGSIRFIFLGVALVPMLFNLLMSWKYTRASNESKAG